MESVTKVVTESAARVERLWAQIGDPDQEGAASSLHEEIKVCCQNFIAGLSERVELLKGQIQEQRQQERAILSRLGSSEPEPDPHPPEPLTSLLSAWRVRVEAARRRETQRTQDVRGRLAALEIVCGLLGHQPPERFLVEGDGLADITEGYLAALTRCVEEQKAEATRRREQTKTLVDALADLFQSLGLVGEEVSHELDRMIQERQYQHIPILKDTIEWMEARQRELEGERDARRAKFGELLSKMDVIWTRLGHGAAERQDKRKRFEGSLSLTTFKKMNRELEACTFMFKQSLQRLIDKERTKIEELWEQLFFAPGLRRQQAGFVFLANPATEEALEEHEGYRKQLQDRLGVALPILKLIEQREGYIRDRQELKARANDANKYKEPGYMLRENKMRHGVEKRLPKLEAQLRERLMEYSAQYGAFQMTADETFLERMDREAEDELTRREREKAARRQRRESSKLQPRAQRKSPKVSLRAVATANRCAQRLVSNTPSVRGGNKRRPLTCPPRNRPRPSDASTLDGRSTVSRHGSKRRLGALREGQPHKKRKQDCESPRRLKRSKSGANGGQFGFR